MIYSEVDDEGWEIRKVEQYRDGHVDVADHAIATGSTILSEVPLPSLVDVNARSEFQGVPISQAEFDDVWTRAGPQRD